GSVCPRREFARQWLVLVAVVFAGPTGFQSADDFPVCTFITTPPKGKVLAIIDPDKMIHVSPILSIQNTALIRQGKTAPTRLLPPKT
ncbi:MAG: hypothetical protein COA47_17005, partial [Robiginitomaculum sp.]